MYEENCSPLPHKDASVVFAKQLAEMKRHVSAEGAANVAPESVVRWADRRNEPHFAAICRRLLLPGSGVAGSANLQRLVELARKGSPCLLCLNHRSNLDVPTLYTLLEDQAESDLFHQIIWLAGRKLEEDVGMASLLIQCFNRVIVTPPGWFASQHTDEELHDARRINIAANRAVSRLRREGWVFGLFPSATRIRPGDESTQHAMEQTDSYLRMFQYLLLCNIDGCTLPVSSDRDFTHETPKLDRVIYSFGQVHAVKAWRREAASRYPDLDQRLASAHAITEDIDALAVGNLEERP